MQQMSFYVKADIHLHIAVYDSNRSTAEATGKSTGIKVGSELKQTTLINQTHSKA